MFPYPGRFPVNLIVLLQSVGLIVLINFYSINEI